MRRSTCRWSGIRWRCAVGWRRRRRRGRSTKRCWICPAVPGRRCRSVRAEQLARSGGRGFRRVLRGAACGGGRAGTGGIRGGAHLRWQGGGAAIARTCARRRAAGGGAAGGGNGSSSPRSIASSRGRRSTRSGMATVAAVYTVAPFVRSAEEFLQSLMPRQPGDKTRKAKKGETPAVRPRPVAKRAWASLEREPAEVIAEALLEAERHDPERVKRWVVLVDGGRDAAGPRGSGRRRLRRGGHGGPRHHPRGRVRLEGGARVP